MKAEKASLVIGVRVGEACVQVRRVAPRQRA
jgi:hypothetical protein